MKLLAIMRPPPGTDVRPQIAARATSELRALWGLYREGVVRELYSPGRPGAVLVLEADSVEDGKRSLGSLPLLAEGIVELDVLELLPFAAFEMIFAQA